MLNPELLRRTSSTHADLQAVTGRARGENGEWGIVGVERGMVRGVWDVEWGARHVEWAVEWGEWDV